MPNSLTETIRAHVESHYPLLYLLTHAENEADALIRDLADGRKILEWNMARGMVDFATKRPLIAWCDLATALDNLLDQDLEHHVIVIRDAHLGLRDQPLAIARLKLLVNRILADDDSAVTLFLISSQVLLPPELEKFITLFELPLPDETVISEELDSYTTAYDTNLDAASRSKLALALQGLTRYEIGQLINRSYQRSGKISLDDLDLVLTEKAQIIKKSGILEMLTVREKLEDIGGLGKLKPWLQQKSLVLSNWPEARAFGVEPPKGVMIVGMPGCGKSLTAKATAALFNLPLLKLDMGSLMGKYVGESEGNMRRAIQVAEAVSPCVLWVDEVEKRLSDW
ncbi:AAA family ATPase [Chromatium okenii]|uniref:AAA family ATPase n=1 Tax=Chromatium okenii TaxID=61644 RepID=UPI00241322DC|nr:AAA family ATPase [Chromatium okenii]